jgi:hypothetical protein
MRKPALTKAQVISAIQAAARRLRRTPTRPEFERLSRIHHMKVRAAGLQPDRLGLRIDTAAMLEDWGRLARKLKRHPTRAEYEKLGRYAGASLETRFHRWSNVRQHFLEFVQRSGSAGQWRDVVETLQSGPIPRRGGGKSWLNSKRSSVGETSLPQRLKPDSSELYRRPEGLLHPVRAERFADRADDAVDPTILPPLRGKRCVTDSMLWILFAGNEKTAQPGAAEKAPDRDGELPGDRQNALAEYRNSGLPGHQNTGLLPRSGAAVVEMESCAVAAPLNFARRVLPGRPLMGPPAKLKGLGHEPVNEMGVVFLFGMIAHLLGFVVEALQMGFPDCLAKLEVEPGRWQHVRIEFEFESRKFREHRHDPAQCDMIVCWRHNWRECPPQIQVLELSRVLAGK